MRILLTFAFCFLLGGVLKAQTSHVVNTVDDVDDGVCDAQHCSLREAINAANTDGFNSFITFKINGVGTKVITLESALPIISGTLEIDGNSLPGNAPTNGSLVIDGNNQINNGLHFETPEVEIYGIQFQGFLENAILLESQSVDIPTTTTIGRRRRGNIFINNGTAVRGINIEDLFFKGNYVGTNLNFEEGLGNQNGIIVENDWASLENSLLEIGGDKDRLEHNYFASSSEKALSLSYQGIAIIEGNTFGTGPQGDENLGNNIAIQTANGRGRVDIGGNPDTKNIFAYNETAVIIDDNNFVSISENSFYCNGLSLNITRNTYPIPTITSGVETMLVGTAQPFDVIEVYVSDEATCQSDDCQGMTYLGNAGASNTGDWQFPGFFDFGQQIVTLSRNSGRQSSFSQCFKVCPGSIQSVASNAGPYCENDTLQLYSDLDVFGFQWVTQFDETDVVYEWTGPNGFISNEKHPKKIAESGNYTLQTYLLGCPAIADTTTVQVTTLKATIDEVPVSCRAESIELKSNIESNLSRLDYQWTGPNGYTSKAKNPLDAIVSGTYSLEVSGGGCKAESASVVVTNHFPEAFSLGASTNICLGESLSLSVPNYEHYQWESDLSLTCDTCSTIELFPTKSTEIRLIAGPTSTCTAEATLGIEVLEPISVTEERTLCPGSTLTLFTKTIDQPGTYRASFTAQSGCDSNHTFIVTQPEVNRVVEVRTICEGETIDQFGTTYSAEGIYEAAFTAANGCDSIHVLELSVLVPKLVTETFTICAGESMNVFGESMTESTTASKVFTATNGCDSTHQINLTVRETYEETAKVTLCPGETVDIDGVTIGQNGFFQRDFTASNGCDSVVMLEVEVLTPIETFQLITMCEDEALAIFGDASAFPGDYVETFTAQSGCDSVNYVSYDIKRQQEVEEFFTICGTDRFILEGNEITTSGRYSYTYTGANGCDSTHITDVTVLDIPYGETSFELCPGESIDIFGTMVSSAGIYSSVLSNVNGCDSFHTVTVFIKESQTTNEVVTLCEGETTSIFDQLVSSEGVHNQTFVGNNGCDSTHTIEVIILQKVQTEANTTVCASACIELYGATACLDKVYQQTFTAVSGCDSIHTLLLEIVEPQEVVEEYSLCIGDSISIFDTFIKEAGTFSQTFTGANGCDSLHTLIVTQPEISRMIETQTICEGEVYTQAGSSYFSSGIYESAFTGINGCDSIHVLALTVLTPSFAEETLELCAGESITIFGESVSEPGMFSKVFTSANGCDSTHQVSVEMLEAEATSEILSICEGEEITLFDQLITDEAVVSKTFSNRNGCDSTHTISVQIMKAQQTNEVLTICEGEEITLFDKVISSDDLVSQTFSALNGCDSTHTIEVRILNKISTESTTTICANACLELYGATACANKAFKQTFTSSSGCDSIHTLFLVTTDQAETTETHTLCPGDSLSVFGDFIKEEGTFSNSFISVDGCDSLHTIIVSFSEELKTDFITNPSCLENNGGSVTVSVAGGVAPYTVTWNGIDQGNMMQFNNLEPGNYDFVVTDLLGCQASQQAIIAAIPSPEIETEILAISCYGAADGEVNLFSNQPNLSYSLDGVNYFETPSFSDLSPATYQIYIRDETGCNYTQEFTLIEPTPLIVTLPEERIIPLGASIQLTPVLNAENVNFDWTATSSLSCLDCQNPIANPLEDTQYTLTIYDENNCEGQAQIWVRVDDHKKVYVPNVFSPDDDGMNDNFSILTIDGPVQEVETFKVYDRWGNLMYEANNFDPLDENYGWNGRYKGKPMDNGVYIYYALIKYVDGTEEELAGDVTLTK